MADPNLVSFYNTLAQFEKRRQQDDVFQATGTHSPRNQIKSKRKFRRALWPVLLVAACIFGLKGMILQSVGDKVYTARVLALQTGQGFDRLEGWMMQPEPISQFVSKKITQGLALLTR